MVVVGEVGGKPTALGAGSAPEWNLLRHVWQVSLGNVLFTMWITWPHTSQSSALRGSPPHPCGHARYRLPETLAHSMNGYTVDRVWPTAPTNFAPSHHPVPLPLLSPFRLNPRLPPLTLSKQAPYRVADRTLLDAFEDLVDILLPQTHLLSRQNHHQQQTTHHHLAACPRKDTRPMSGDASIQGAILPL